MHPNVITIFRLIAVDHCIKLCLLGGSSQQYSVATNVDPQHDNGFMWVLITQVGFPNKSMLNHVV